MRGISGDGFVELVSYPKFTTEGGRDHTQDTEGQMFLPCPHPSPMGVLEEPTLRQSHMGLLEKQG